MSDFFSSFILLTNLLSGLSKISIELIFCLILEISLFFLSIFIFSLLSFSMFTIILELLFSFFSLLFILESKILKRSFKRFELLLYFLFST